MKNILFPTDFSSAANNALEYATEFAKKMEAKLTLFNVYPVKAYVTDIPMEVSLNEELKHEAEISIEKMAADIYSSSPGLTVDSCISWGFAADEVVFNAREKKIDLIVMGTHGAGGLKKFLLGSNTAEVVNKAGCPVLAVPDGLTFKNFQHIAYSTDCLEYEIPSIKKAIEWARKFKTSFTLVHVSDGIMNKPAEKYMMDHFLQKVKTECLFPSAEIETVEMPDIAKGLTDFILNNDVDLLVIAHKKRNLLKQLINPSLSRKLAFKLACPLLSLPV